MKLKRPLILASQSPRRREILRQLGFKFKIKSGKFVEFTKAKTPKDLALKNACGKASEIAAKSRPKDLLILGCDTIVVAGKKIFGKPASEKDALSQIRALSRAPHKVLSAICLIDCLTGKHYHAIEKTTVEMDSLTPKEIHEYVKSGEGFDKAGSYAIQGLGALHIRRIKGDYFNVVGLPVNSLKHLIKKVNGFY